MKWIVVLVYVRNWRAYRISIDWLKRRTKKKSPLIMSHRLMKNKCWNIENPRSEVVFFFWWRWGRRRRNTTSPVTTSRRQRRRASPGRKISRRRPTSDVVSPARRSRRISRSFLILLLPFLFFFSSFFPGNLERIRFYRFSFIFWRMSVVYNARA